MPPESASVTVATLLKDLQSLDSAIDLELLAGASGLARHITNSHPQKTGLALAGFDGYLREGRALILGESEIRYLESLQPPPGWQRSAVCCPISCRAS
jgi:serine kinase of HPr protein (carbohydrate metabolism regulator)